MRITEQHKKYLSSILTGTSEDEILATVSTACYVWGLNPDTPEPTDVEWSKAEQEALDVLRAIREGLADGTVTPAAAAPIEYVMTDADGEDAALLAAFGK